MADTEEPQPGPLNYVVGFTLVGIAWGLTTPFIRRAAKDHHPAPHLVLESEAVKASWLKSRTYGAFFAVVDLLRNPRYAVPLLLNLTGSVWFFLLIGQAELSLTVPIVNTLAFLFTVIGDWWVDGKVISRNTMAGYYFSLLPYPLAWRLIASTGHFMPSTPNALATEVIHGATFWLSQAGSSPGMDASRIAPSTTTLAIHFLSSIIAVKQYFTDKLSSMVLSLTGIALCVHSKNK